MRVFEPAWIGPLKLENRLLRSATFEGLCDAQGTPAPGYGAFYRKLSRQGLGALITGFAYTSLDGRAVQPGQAGLETDAKVPAFRDATEAVHGNGGRIFLQLAHAGRQTVPAATGGVVYGASEKRSPYFGSRPRRLTESQIGLVIGGFAQAARRAREAGFDGVQLHAAHGYLVHQFLNPAINDRTDAYGIDPRRGIGTAFLEQVIARVRAACGADFPVLVKVSAADNYRHGCREREFIELIRFLDAQSVDGIEVSFGTMDHALNIFRGASIPVEAILDVNPRYRTRHAWQRRLWKWLILRWVGRSFAPFAPMYNLEHARRAKQHTRLPVICVGGFRNGREIRSAVEEHGIDFVSLCRPLLREPDFALKLQRDENYQSRCANCNECAVRCDSGVPTRCYQRTLYQFSLACAVQGRYSSHASHPSHPSHLFTRVKSGILVAASRKRAAFFRSAALLRDAATTGRGVEL
jgi:2,4-dienoyl-CoA reductase-like NADH-dependent reductase (Old Yellow Enzyme family)